MSSTGARVHLFLLVLACSGPRGRCGEGTTKVDGECIVEGEPLVCGPGTTEVEGACEADPVAVDDAELLYLPFPAGTPVWISQGNQSGFSHNGWQAWSVDFPVDEGTPIAAVRSGVVVDARSDSNTGCGDASCAGDANYVRIDHGDGTFSQYLHLEQGGVDVAIGDLVGQGQQIGRSGNTGWSTGPHLHLDYLGSHGFTTPVRFAEIEAIFGDGTPFSGLTVTSANQVEPPPEALEPSSCTRDAFLYRGVTLTSDVPCSVAGIGVGHPLEADVPVGFDLAVHRWSTVRQEWMLQCLTADPTGHVSDELRFGAANFQGSSYLMLSAVPAGSGCAEYWSWITSPKIHLR